MQLLRYEAKGASPVSEDGVIEFIGSTSTPDRVGDIVEQDWDLTAYKTNPVVLYGHDHDALPIAKTLSVGVVDGRLRFKAQFVPASIYPFAGTVRALYELGFLRAFSVGFRTTEPTTPSGVGYGERIKRAELLEVSAVAVPMNAEALIASKGVGGIVPLFSKANAAKVHEAACAGRDDAAVSAWLSPSLEEPVLAPELECQLKALSARVAELEIALKAALAARVIAEEKAAETNAMQPTVAAQTNNVTETVAATSAAGLDDDDEAAYAAERNALEQLIAAERNKLGDRT